MRASSPVYALVDSSISLFLNPQPRKPFPFSFTSPLLLPSCPFLFETRRPGLWPAVLLVGLCQYDGYVNTQASLEYLPRIPQQAPVDQSGLEKL